MKATGMDLPDCISQITILHIYTGETRKLSGLVVDKGQRLIDAVNCCLRINEIAVVNYDEKDFAHWQDAYFKELDT